MRGLGALQRRPWTQRLGVRLASLMAVALLPLGIMAYLQTSNLAREAQGRSEEALMGETLRAAAGEIKVISQAQGMVAALANAVPDLVNDIAACSALMSQTLKSSEDVGLLSFVPISGLMTCSSNGQSFDYSEIPLFKSIISSRTPSFTMSQLGPVLGTSVLGVIHPVFSRDGSYIGYASAWLPHTKLRVLQESGDLQTESTPDRLVEFWSFNKDGDLLTASMDIDAVQKFLPEGKPLASFAVNQAQVFTTRSNVGAKTTYAVMPVVTDQLYIMSSWNNPGGSSGFSNILGPTWFPILLWVAGLGTSIWAAEILVVRHVRALNRSISSFARGQRHRLELDLSAAPLELHEMAKAYATMTDDITRNEANLEDNVHQKEVLLREVHHRVKNNLQLIASIMNMQIRQARTPEARGLLKGLQDRIMSLATIHRGLYQTTGLTDIHANELLADITRQTVNMATGPGRQINVSTEFDDIRLTPDQAVPLSLFLTEALTNALKYARSPDGSAPLLHVALKRQSDGHAVLSLINSAASKPEMADPDTLNTSTGLGAQLLVAFSQQIGGTLSQEQIGDSYHLRITFVIADLVEAENRLAAIDETSDAAPAI